MKKLISIFLVLSFIFLVGCSKDYTKLPINVESNYTSCNNDMCFTIGDNYTFKMTWNCTIINYNGNFVCYDEKYNNRIYVFTNNTQWTLEKVNK